MVLLPQLETAVVPTPPAARPAGKPSRARRRKVKGLQKKLWQGDVKKWLSARDKLDDFAREQKDEEELTIWFNALDVDRSGSVEEDEICDMMKTMGMEVKRGFVAEIFESTGFDASAELNLNDFIKLMSQHGDKLTGGAFATTTTGAGRGAFAIDANMRLMMLAYRRQRLLQDIADPKKRRRFVDRDTFDRHYGSSLYQPDAAAESEEVPGAKDGELKQSNVTLPPLPFARLVKRASRRHNKLPALETEVSSASPTSMQQLVRLRCLRPGANLPSRTTPEFSPGAPEDPGPGF